MTDKKTIEQLAEDYAIQLEKNHYATETYHPASYYSGVDVGFLAGAAKQKELCNEREKELLTAITDLELDIEYRDIKIAELEQKLKDLKWVSLDNLELVKDPMTIL